MNTQLIESLVQIIQALSEEEQLLIKAKLFGNIPYPSIVDITQLVQSGGAFQFLQDEPDIYTIEDGEPI
jgi:hypothetical protein